MEVEITLALQTVSVCVHNTSAGWIHALVSFLNWDYFFSSGSYASVTHWITNYLWMSPNSVLDKCIYTCGEKSHTRLARKSVNSQITNVISLLSLLLGEPKYNPKIHQHACRGTWNLWRSNAKLYWDLISRFWLRNSYLTGWITSY